MSYFICEVLGAQLDFLLAWNKRLPPLSNEQGDTAEGVIFPGQCQNKGKEKKEGGFSI